LDYKHIGHVGAKQQYSTITGHRSLTHIRVYIIAHSPTSVF